MSFRIRHSSGLFPVKVVNGDGDPTLRSDLEASTGSDIVGYDNGTVQDVLIQTTPLNNYTQLRSYTGIASGVRIIDNGIAGIFQVDVSDNISTDNSGTIIVDSLSRRWKRTFVGEYLDSWWSVLPNGTTDNTDIYINIASILPNGSTLLCVGSGTRILSDQITFPQENFNFICDAGVKFKQKDATFTLDRLFLFSGNNAKIVALDVDGNVSGNPTISYTGRGELVKVSGMRAEINSLYLRNTHVKDFSCGLYITGNDCFVKEVFGFGTGRVAIRDRGDRTTIRDVRCRDIVMNSGGIGNKVIAKDGGAGDISGAFQWVLYDNIYGRAEGNGFYELIVVDDSFNIGDRVTARNLFADFPNATGPDVIKFVNTRRVDIDCLTTINAGNGVENPCLRFQEGISDVYLKGLDLAGMINFDTTTPVYCVVAGDCEIGRTLTGPVCIDDFPNGTLVIEDGAILRGFTANAIATRTDAFNTKITLGRISIIGASGGTPSSRRVIKYRAYLTGTPLTRISAGQVRVKEPIDISNTPLPGGLWIMDSDALDASVIQGETGSFLVASTNFTTNGPQNVSNWRRNMEILRRDPIAGQTAYSFMCTTSGASCQVSWAISIAYTTGQWVANGSNVYVCTTSGTSASSGGGPTGTGTGIIDGTCVWNYVDIRAVFKAVASISA